MQYDNDRRIYEIQSGTVHNRHLTDDEIYDIWRGTSPLFKQVKTANAQFIKSVIQEELSKMPKGGRVIMNLEQLKSVDVKFLSVFEAVAVKLFLTQFKAALLEADAEVPDWVNDKLRLVNAHVTECVRADYERRLKNAQSRFEALATPEEKRAVAQTEIEELKKKLESK